VSTSKTTSTVVSTSNLTITVYATGHTTSTTFTTTKNWYGDDYRTDWSTAREDYQGW
jgi:hypothetical protein